MAMPLYGFHHQVVGCNLCAFHVKPFRSIRRSAGHQPAPQARILQPGQCRLLLGGSLQPVQRSGHVKGCFPQALRRSQLGCSTTVLQEVATASGSESELEYQTRLNACFSSAEEEVACAADSEVDQASDSWQEPQTVSLGARASGLPAFIVTGEQLSTASSPLSSSSSASSAAASAAATSAASAAATSSLPSSLSSSIKDPAGSLSSPLTQDGASPSTSVDDFISSTSLIPTLASPRSDTAAPTTTTTVITTTITTTMAACTSNRSITTTSISIQRGESAMALDSMPSTASISMPCNTSPDMPDSITTLPSSHSSAATRLPPSDSATHRFSRSSADGFPSKTASETSSAIFKSASTNMLPFLANRQLPVDGLPQAASSLAQGAGSVHKADQPSTSAKSPTDSTSNMSIWALFMLFISYVHHSASGSAVPAMLPVISPDLHLSDLQGAFLTSGYFYLYAIALIPVGLAADRTSRPLLLSAGLTLWSALTMKMGQVHDFNELLMARVGFAAAQATQNPISFALIPELFPKNKTTALAVYNCAMHLGRALSFAAVMLAQSHPAAPMVADQVTAQMLPMDQLDLHKTSLLYVQGNMAAVLPIYDYNYQIIEYGPVQEAAWRHLLWCIGLPGLLIAGLLAFTVREPRSKQNSSMGAEIIIDSDSESTGISEAEADNDALRQSASKPEEDPKSNWPSMGLLSGLGLHARVPALALATQAAAAAPAELGVVSQTPPPFGQFTPPTMPSLKLPSFDAGPLSDVLKMPSFQAVTLAAAMNDVGSYALIAWHSTFYERVFHLDSSIYAPLLAIVTPIGGIVGGVGGGFLADYLDKKGGRAWMTVGASLLGAPLMAASLLAPTYQMSFAALLCGFAMSEAWRSPSAIMISSIASPSQASTAQSLYICIRNLVGGIGPLAVAELSEQVGLQKALLLAPVCYLFSGLIFLVAEQLLAQKPEQNASIPQLKEPSN